jgi:hypothetical protein
MVGVPTTADPPSPTVTAAVRVVSVDVKATVKVGGLMGTAVVPATDAADFTAPFVPKTRGV